MIDLVHEKGRERGVVEYTVRRPPFLIYASARMIIKSSVKC